MQSRDLTPDIRASLQAKLERMIARPLVAAVVRPANDERTGHDSGPAAFQFLRTAAQSSQPTASRVSQAAWQENADEGTCTVRIQIDYLDAWRGSEREILEIVRSTIETPVTFLTADQQLLLERSPREFLKLTPRPETAELVSYRTEDIGGAERVTELTVAAPPATPQHVTHIAIVPNLVQIERQLDALEQVLRSSDEGPIAPLRVLLGLADPSLIQRHAEEALMTPVVANAGERLDEFQAACIAKALSTPHFAVIQGPPGSGKTTVITSIVRRSMARGHRVLVVSPTHVAVDNVVEKLLPRTDRRENDHLEPHTIPVRYAARKSRLSDRAAQYWVGNKQQARGAAIARRLQERLSTVLPEASGLYAREDQSQPGNAPLSGALAAVQRVICGTPIGILSYAPVGSAAPGEYDLLIVDEVSKMTLPEFLAIAVKARRWVLVGDPQQLPPYNNSEENAPTLDDVVDPRTELVCSVGGILERARPFERPSVPLLVVTDDPDLLQRAVAVHLSAVGMQSLPPFSRFGIEPARGVCFCSPGELADAGAALAATCARDLTQSPNYRGFVAVLVQRGIRVPRPAVASGLRLVEPRQRAQALVYENAFNVYHAQPWTDRSDQKLPLVGFRNGIEKYMPSLPAARVLREQAERASENVRDAMAARFAINTVSVYDWLTGIPCQSFDVSPLRELAALSPLRLCDAVQPFVGVLKKQYRMHPSLSLVPRNLFYFDEALHDGAPDGQSGCRVVFVQVPADDRGTETSPAECERICQLLEQLNAGMPESDRKPVIMVITPYREQRALLEATIRQISDRGVLAKLDVDAYTLDSCQGREAEYVFVSLVRSRATPFFDMPKRWNVALTRAMQGLFVVGNIDAYLQEAARARNDPRNRPGSRGGTGKPRPMMSLLARIVEAYDRQIADDKAIRTSGS